MDYNDELSRKTVALSQVFKHIQSDIIEVIDYYNEKGVDCVGVDKNGNDVCYIEVECANYWKNQPYFRSFVSLPQRKRWYLSEQEWNKKLEYVEGIKWLKIVKIPWSHQKIVVTGVQTK